MKKEDLANLRFTEHIQDKRHGKTECNRLEELDNNWITQRQNLAIKK